jgi:hypothetical protein
VVHPLDMTIVLNDSAPSNVDYISDARIVFGILVQYSGPLGVLSLKLGIWSLYLGMLAFDLVMLALGLVVSALDLVMLAFNLVMLALDLVMLAPYFVIFTLGSPTRFPAEFPIVAHG